MAISSQIRIPLAAGEKLIADWKAAGLLKASVFKPVFATIEQTLATRKLGTLSGVDIRSLREILSLVLG